MSVQNTIKKPKWPIYIVTLCLLLTTNIVSKEIKIGISTALTGNNKTIGKLYSSGALYALQNANKKNYLGNNTIKVILKDDMYTPERTIKNTVHLLENEKVDYLFGYVGTPSTLSAITLLPQFEKKLYFPYTGATIFTFFPHSKYVSIFRPTYKREINEILNYFFDKKYSKIAVFFQLDSYGTSGLSAIKSILKKEKLSPIKEISYTRGKRYNESFQIEASLLINSSPDAIICISTYEASAGIIRDVRKSSSNIPIATISFSDKEKVHSLLMETNESLFFNLLHSDISSEHEKSKALNQYLTYTKGVFENTEYEGFLAGLAFVEILKASIKNPNKPLPTKTDIGLPYPINLNKSPILNNIYLSTSHKGNWVYLNNQ